MKEINQHLNVSHVFTRLAIANVVIFKKAGGTKLNWMAIYQWTWIRRRVNDGRHELQAHTFTCLTQVIQVLCDSQETNHISRFRSPVMQFRISLYKLTSTYNRSNEDSWLVIDNSVAPRDVERGKVAGRVWPSCFVVQYALLWSVPLWPDKEMTQQGIRYKYVTHT